MLEVNIRSAGYEIGEKTIHDIAFSIEKGELVALIGANGAGKSTTIKTMLGLLVNMDGEISLGEKKNPYAYVPEHPTYYDYLTLWEHIELLMAARGSEMGTGKNERNNYYILFEWISINMSIYQSFQKV